MARENPAYAGLGRDACGRFELAGKSVAVPFVGVAAAGLVVAEALRLLHAGPSFADLRFSLGTPRTCAAKLNGNYSAQDAAGLNFVSVNLATT
jgi:hypothetical protein